jgi:hypothetical protein
MDDEDDAFNSIGLERQYGGTLYWWPLSSYNRSRVPFGVIISLAYIQSKLKTLK